MHTITNPVQITHFNQQYKNRITQKIYAEPISDLPEHLRTLIDIVYNNAIPSGSILPDIMEKHLMVAAEFSYHIAYSRAHNVFDTKVVIDISNANGDIHVYIEKESGLELRIFKVVQHQNVTNFADKDLTKSEYFKNAGRTTKSKHIQYSSDLDIGYKILFNIIYYVGIDEVNIPIDDLADQLYTLLDNSEVTLNLSLNQTAMVYGSVSSSNVVNLHVREVGTPDTFYTRTFALASLY